MKYLREQTPVLLCVDEWTHWITVCAPKIAGSSSSTRNDDPVLSLRTWPQLRNWWSYHDVDYSRTTRRSSTT